MMQMQDRLEIILSALAFTDAGEFGRALEMLFANLPAAPGDTAA